MLTEKLLDSLLPSDPQGYSEADMEIIRRSESCRVEEDLPEINEEEVKCALFSMGKKNAPGFDDLTVEILCRAWDTVRGRITAVMNRSLQEGMFPNHWKIGIVKVLYKRLGKDPQVPNSYRPLTLLPVLGKDFEKLLNKRILNVLEGQNKFHD